MNDIKFADRAKMRNNDDVKHAIKPKTCFYFYASQVWTVNMIIGLILFILYIFLYELINHTNFYSLESTFDDADNWYSMILMQFVECLNTVYIRSLTR